MRKIQKILIGVLLAGVLTGGVGTGVALVEYGSFAYGGEKQLGAEHLVTKTFDHAFDAEKGSVALGCDWFGGDVDSEVQTDAAVPAGTVRYEITYNEAMVSPYLIYEENRAEPEDDEPPVQGYLHVGLRDRVSDLEMWMLCKDDVLAELKQRRICSYDVAYITDVQIKINPETMPYVIDETRY